MWCRDYVDFNASMERLEADLQQYINTSFDRSTSIRDSLVLLKKFQEVRMADRAGLPASHATLVPDHDS